jgi:hypothetical protein
MDDPCIQLTRDSLTLLAAAERLQLGDRACATLLPVAFERIERSLRALSRGCYGAAHALIPPGEDIARRYERAAADWPGAEPPSHERQAELLASLHETAEALRRAATSCARAGELLSATVDAPAGLERRSATPRAA